MKSPIFNCAEYNGFLTLVEILRQRAVQQPQQRAYMFLLDGETQEVYLTYEQLDRQARAIGARLQTLGASGKRVLLLYQPGLDYIAGFFGCLYAGAVAVPAYPPDPARIERTLPRLQAIVADAQATFALTTTSILSIAEMVFEYAPDLAALGWLTSDEINDADAGNWQVSDIKPDTLAFLQYTSGSTAAPRGVMLTHANLLHNLALIQTCFTATADSRGAIWLPPYHDMGLIGGILQPLYSGFPVVLMSPLDFLRQPLHWLQAVSRYKATISGGPNFAYDLCVRKITPQQCEMLDLSAWEVAFNGAEPVRRETMERFAQTFARCGFRYEAFYPCYGLAEATLIVSGGLRAKDPMIQTVDSAALAHNQAVRVPPAYPNAQSLVACGHTLADQQIVITDPELLRLCPPGQIGEIWVCGPSVAQGYWNQPEKTAHTFQAYLVDNLASGSQGPFLRTGDLGFMLDDELYVTGRAKDLIIIRGRNHYPQDIEASVEQSHPALRSGCCATFSVEEGGEERLVIAQEIKREAEPAIYQEIIHAIRQAVAEQHELQAYGVILLKPGSLPKTSSGKVQRHACRADFLSGRLDAVVHSTLGGEGESGPAEVSPMLSVASEPTFIRKAIDAVLDSGARYTLLTLYLQEQAARVLRLPLSQVDILPVLSTCGFDLVMAVELKHGLETSLGVILPMADSLRDCSLSQLAMQILDVWDKPQAQ